MNLFVIGNGFDKKLHHLPTAYSDFRDYLVDKYPGCEEYDELIPESILMPDGSEKYDIDDVAGYISRILDDCDGGAWWNLESYTDKHNDIVASVLSEGDAFLNFNYTQTLETVYGISDVCHIHGVVGDPDEDIFFGHGDMEDFPESMASFGADWNLNQLKRDLRKDTTAALQRHWDFFEGLHDVKSIYSFGFSFSPVDMVYIEEIARRAKGATWYLNQYADKCTDSRSILEGLGFKVEVEGRW